MADGGDGGGPGRVEGTWMPARRVAAGLTAFREVFASRDLRKVIVAYAGFIAVEYGTWVAILVFAYDATGPGSVAVVAVMQLVPAAVFAPMLGALGDRLRRERVLVLGYLAQAVAMSVTGLAIVTDAPVAVVYASAVVAATSITVIRPTQGALLPVLAADPEQLTAANSATAAIEGLGVLVGPAVTGVVLALWGPGEAFVIAAGVLVLAAAAVLRLRVPRRAAATTTDTSSTGSREGFRTLARDPGSRSVVGVLSTRAAIDGAIDVLLVLVAIELFLTGESGAAYLQAAVGAGIAFGGMTTLLLVGRRRLGPWLVLGTAVFGFAFAVLASVSTQLAGVVLLAVSGVGLALVDVSGRTLLQRIVPESALHRVLGIQEGLMTASLAVGSILVPVVVWVVDLRGALLVFASLLPVAGVLSWRVLHRTEDTVVPPAEGLAILAGLPLFAPLPAPELERLARLLVPVRFAAGTSVIAEGEAGDHFYVINAGRLEVVKGTTRVATLGAGDHFGEIALLRDVPRTATVRTLTDVEAYSLDRVAFLTAVTGDPRSVAEAERVAAERSAGEGVAGGNGRG